MGSQVDLKITQDLLKISLKNLGNTLRILESIMRVGCGTLRAKIRSLLGQIWVDSTGRACAIAPYPDIAPYICSCFVYSVYY